MIVWNFVVNSPETNGSNQLTNEHMTLAITLVTLLPVRWGGAGDINESAIVYLLEFCPAIIETVDK